jgi:HSP20 family protein
MVNMVGQEDWGRQPRQAEQLPQRPRSRAGSGRRVFPSIIVSATDDQLIVRCEVPGMNLDDFDIRMAGDSLVIEGSRLTGEELQGGWYHRRERESGGFSRAVRLPAEVDGDQADASYVAGILTVTLPLKKAAKPRQVPVKVMEA